MRFYLRTISILVLVFAGQALAVEPEAPEDLISSDNAIGLKIRLLLSDDKMVKDAEIRDSLNEFYQDRNFKPIWITRSGTEARSKQMIKEISQADDFGLRSSDYVLPATSVKTSPWPDASEDIARVELQYSLAAVTYARDARGGRIKPSSLSGYLDINLDLPSAGLVLSSILKASDAGASLRDFQPKNPEFEALRKMLLASRGKNEKQEKVGPIIPLGPTLRLGDEHDHVKLLRKRLKIKAKKSGADAEKASSLRKFDDDVLEAVEAFQQSKSLKADGIVGPGTRRALNGTKPPRNRESLILVNMERWRWYPNEMGEFHVVMNIPEQKVRIFKNNKVIHSARTIVGKITNQTPVFNDEMEFIVFHPTWSVPNSIKVKEILPYLQNNTSWFFSSPTILSTHNLYMKLGGKEINPNKVNWNSADIRRYHVYQPPGPKNVLGVVKFMFPNRHAVYMHDTIEKHYFSEPVRNFSHGCVRIQHSEKFARVLLGQDKGWSQSQVTRFVSRGGTTRVGLDRKIPVYLTYFTAEVDQSGNLDRHMDLYGHDSRMARALGLKGIGYSRIAAQPVVKRKKKKKKTSEPFSLQDIFQSF